MLALFKWFACHYLLLNYPALDKEKQEKMVKNAMAKQQQNLARLSPQTNVLPATREGNECCYYLIIFTLNCLLNCLI